MKKDLFFMTAILLSTNCIPTFSKELLSEKECTAKELPNNYVLLDVHKIMNLQSFSKEAVLWPTETEINNQIADKNNQDVQNALKSTIKWLNKILRSEYVPNESDIELIPLKSGAQECDIVRLRYKTSHYIIQVLSTSSSIWIGIKDESKQVFSGSVDTDKARAQILYSIDKFLNKSDLIKHVSVKMIQEKNGVIIGHPDIKPNTCGDWSGLMSWWTDGQTILFSTGKVDRNRPRLPALDKNWFSKQNK